MQTELNYEVQRTDSNSVVSHSYCTLYCCFSSIICTRRRVIDRLALVMSLLMLCQLSCKLILILWTVNSHISYHWRVALSVWLVWFVYYMCWIGFLQCTKLLSITIVIKPNPKSRTPNYLNFNQTRTVKLVEPNRTRTFIVEFHSHL